MFRFLFIFFIFLCQSLFAVKERDVYAVFLNSDFDKEIEKIFKKSLKPLGFDIQKNGLFLFQEGCNYKKNITFVKLKFSSSEDRKDDSKERLSGVIKGNSYSDELSRKGFFFIEEQERLFSIDFEGNIQESYEKFGTSLKDHTNEIQRTSFGEEKPLFFLVVSNIPIM